MGESMILTGISLKMVVDSWSLDAIKDLIDVGLPFVGGFKITEWEKSGLRIHERCYNLRQD